MTQGPYFPSIHNIFYSLDILQTNQLGIIYGFASARDSASGEITVQTGAGEYARDILFVYHDRDIITT
jgi:hypothetical protein